MPSRSGSAFRGVLQNNSHCARMCASTSNGFEGFGDFMIAFIVHNLSNIGDSASNERIASLSVQRKAYPVREFQQKCPNRRYAKRTWIRARSFRRVQYIQLIPSVSSKVSHCGNNHSMRDKCQRPHFPHSCATSPWYAVFAGSAANRSATSRVANDARGVPVVRLQGSVVIIFSAHRQQKYCPVAFSRIRVKYDCRHSGHVLILIQLFRFSGAWPGRLHRFLLCRDGWLGGESAKSSCTS